MSWSSRSNRQRIAVDVVLAGVAFVALDVFCALLYLELTSSYHGDVEWPALVVAVLICAACIVGIVKRPAHHATAP